MEFMETLHTELQPCGPRKETKTYKKKFDSHELGTVWFHLLYVLFFILSFKI